MNFPNPNSNNNNNNYSNNENSNNNNNYYDNKNNKMDFEVKNINKMILDLNKNIQNIDEKFNNINNNNKNDFKKNSDFNMGKIGFYNNNNNNNNNICNSNNNINNNNNIKNNINDFPNNDKGIQKLNNKMVIDDDLSKAVDPMVNQNPINSNQQNNVNSNINCNNNNNQINNSNNNSNNNNSNQNSSYNSNDISLINEINGKHQDIKKILDIRKKTLRGLAKFCMDKDIPSTLNYLNMINDLTIYHDFLNYSLLQSQTIRVPLTMDNACFLLDHVIDLVNSKYDNYKKVGVHSALVILRLFSDRIITTKCSSTVGIDLSKEDRLKKCDKIIEIYKSFRVLNSLEMIFSKKIQDEVRFFI